MDAASILNILLPAVFVLVGLALIWLLVELVRTLRAARKVVNDVQTHLTPTIAHLEAITGELEPVVSRVDPLVERVSLTVDAANLELMRVDQILENVGDVTGTVSNATNTIDNVTKAPVRMVSSVSERVRKLVNPAHGSEESARLAAQASEDVEYTEELLAQLEEQEAALAREAEELERVAEAEAASALADAPAPDVVADAVSAEPAVFEDAAAFDFSQLDNGLEPELKPDPEPNPEPESEPKLESEPEPGPSRYYTYAVAADAGAATVPTRVPDPLEVPEPAAGEVEVPQVPEETSVDPALSEQDTGQIDVDAVNANLKTDGQKPVDFSDLFDLSDYSDDQPATADTDIPALDGLAAHIVAPEPEAEPAEVAQLQQDVLEAVAGAGEGAVGAVAAAAEPEEDPADIADALAAAFADVQETELSRQPTGEIPVIHIEETSHPAAEPLQPVAAEIPKAQLDASATAPQAHTPAPAPAASVADPLGAAVQAANAKLEAATQAAGRFEEAPAEAVSAFAAGSAQAVGQEGGDTASAIEAALDEAMKRLASEMGKTEDEAGE